MDKFSVHFVSGLLTCCSGEETPSHHIVGQSFRTWRGQGQPTGGLLSIQDDHGTVLPLRTSPGTKFMRTWRSYILLIIIYYSLQIMGQIYKKKWTWNETNCNYCRNGKKGKKYRIYGFITFGTLCMAYIFGRPLLCFAIFTQRFPVRIQYSLDWGCTQVGIEPRTMPGLDYIIE